MRGPGITAGLTGQPPQNPRQAPCRKPSIFGPTVCSADHENVAGAGLGISLLARPGFAPPGPFRSRPGPRRKRAFLTRAKRPTRTHSWQANRDQSSRKRIADRAREQGLAGSRAPSRTRFQRPIMFLMFVFSGKTAENSDFSAWAGLGSAGQRQRSPTGSARWLGALLIPVSFAGDAESFFGFCPLP